MRRKNIFVITANICLLLFLCVSKLNCCSEPTKAKEAVILDQEKLDILLPEKIYAVEGMPLEIFFDNLILSQTPDQYKYEMRINGKNAGEYHRRKWVLSPSNKDLGTQTLEIRIIDPKDNSIKSSKTANLVVSSKNKKLNIKLLSIGDSLGHQSRFPSRLHDLCKQQDQKVKFLGSHFPKGSCVHHEQYGGWTWERFLTLYEPGKKSVYHTDRSPFVFLDPQTKKPTFNFERYISETLKGEKPDVVSVVLGINDAFSLPAEDPKLLKQGTLLICENALKLVSAIQSSLPKAKILIGMVIPANSSKTCFNDVYKDSKLTPYRWKVIAHALNETYVECFSQKKNVYLMSTNLGVDSIDHYNAHAFIPESVTYSVTHVVHPNSFGDSAIAKNIYYALVGTFSQTDLP